MHHNNNNPRIHNIREVEGNSLHHNSNNCFSKQTITKLRNWAWIAKKSTTPSTLTYNRKEEITPLSPVEQVLWEDQVHHTASMVQSREALMRLKKLLEHQIHQTTSTRTASISMSCEKCQEFSANDTSCTTSLAKERMVESTWPQTW